VQVLDPDRHGLPRAQWRELAPALVSLRRSPLFRPTKRPV